MAIPVLRWSADAAAGSICRPQHRLIMPGGRYSLLLLQVPASLMAARALPGT